MARTIRIVSALNPPVWAKSKTSQRVIILRDVSPSMEGNKAREASAAVVELVNELANPGNKDGFSVAVIDFSGSSKVVNDFTVAGFLEPEPLRVCGSGTNITSGLEQALALLGNVGFESHMFLRPVVLLFSDGGHNTGDVPYHIAEHLKVRADVVTIGFGTDADENMLKQLATSPQHFYRCRNGKELRCFLGAVGKTMSVSLSYGRNATRDLINLNY
ncbi:MAG: vWA domain-containing protein [Candidatus Eremiobacterota bacterium]